MENCLLFAELVDKLGELFVDIDAFVLRENKEPGRGEQDNFDGGGGDAKAPEGRGEQEAR